MHTDQHPAAVRAAQRRQGVIAAAALGRLLGDALARLGEWLAARSARRQQQEELAALAPAVARDLGVDAALLRQASGFAASSAWLQRR